MFDLHCSLVSLLSINWSENSLSCLAPGQRCEERRMRWHTPIEGSLGEASVNVMNSLRKANKKENRRSRCLLADFSFTQLFLSSPRKSLKTIRLWSGGRGVQAGTEVGSVNGSDPVGCLWSEQVHHMSSDYQSLGTGGNFPYLPSWSYSYPDK